MLRNMQLNSVVVGKLQFPVSCLVKSNFKKRGPFESINVTEFVFTHLTMRSLLDKE